MTTKISQSVAGTDLSTLIGDFERHLAAANKSPRTLQTYGESARKLVDFLREQGMPTTAEHVGREHLEAFTADQLARFKPTTASVRYRSLAQLWKWLADEGEVRDNPFLRMKPPLVPEEPVGVIGDDALRRLLAACDGSTFEGRRDTALIRLLLDCGLRCAELMNLTVDDVDRNEQLIVVVGKGRRPRAVHYGVKSAQAVDRYMRLRARHPHAGSAALWLSPKGKLTDGGLRQMLARRGEEAGIGHVHPHQFRHTMAHSWLAADGGEVDLMSLMGWKSRAMVGRYGASAASERAREAHRRKGLGDRI